ncbi:MAG: 3-phosphoshikimate 1-carboxyvinyltransferase [Candidatus Hadarchaeota archaeon]|nr:3-phosphoshikimate 1-carboxyvinyltransferase [Candidatus Hadarchaeota archaeon]
MAWLRVRPSKLEGELTAPPSKSYTHRAFSIGLLADGRSKILRPLISLDTQSTIDAVRTLGAELVESKGNWETTGTGGKLRPRERVIDVKNSGTTLRFISAIAGLSPKPIRITGDESILARPMGPLVESLEKLGVKARCEGRRGRPPVVIGGGISGGEAQMTGTVSSQFISALLLACPYAQEDVDLVVEEEPRSKPYIQMTLKVLQATEAKVRYNSSLTEFEIPGQQTFKPIEHEVPRDFSSAAFVLGGAALTDSNVRVRGLDVHDVQGDKRILDLLREFGADVKVEDKTIEVTGTGTLEGIDADCGGTPDLVPILAVLGAAADGRTTLTNIPHLRFKEVDRLRALSTELKKLGARVKELPDELQIRGTKQLKGGKLSSYGDHRMAMALTVAGMAAKGETVVDGAESIPVSYPDFVKDLQKLGAQLEIQG